MPASLALQQAPYVSLRTFRKSGVAVDTPVWCAPTANGDLCIFSAGQAGKVKRLRHSSAAALAICDYRGRLHGEWIDAHAELVTGAAQVTEALDALHAKYGWQMRLADWGARLTGKYNQRAYIRVRVP